MGNYVLYYPLFAILLSDIELDYLASLLNIVLWFFRFIVVYMIFNFFGNKRRCNHVENMHCPLQFLCLMY
jgi:hypothetical protein